MSMCIIIDANVGHEIHPPSENGRPVVDWIESGNGRLVIGGKNTEELRANGNVGRWLRALTQAGRVHMVPYSEVKAEEKIVGELGLCCSNDAHIVALARISGARLLFSSDRNLHSDFTNPDLISQPRGKIYQAINHRHLLQPSMCRN